MPCPARMAKKALRGDDSGTPLTKNPLSGDGGKGRFARGLAKAQVTNGLFSVEAIIHLAIVTAGALFGHTSSLPRPFLARALPNPSPRSHFLAILANFVLAGGCGTNTEHLSDVLFNQDPLEVAYHSELLDACPSLCSDPVKVPVTEVDCPVQKDEPQVKEVHDEYPVDGAADEFGGDTKQIAHGD